MEIVELLDIARNTFGSDAETARRLGVKPPFIWKVRNGVKPMPPVLEAKLAELLERNPAQAFIEASIRAAAKKEEAANLKRWFKSLAASIAVAVVAVGLSGFSTSARANGWHRTHVSEQRGNVAKVSRTIQCVLIVGAASCKSAAHTGTWKYSAEMSVTDNGHPAAYGFWFGLGFWTAGALVSAVAELLTLGIMTSGLRFKASAPPKPSPAVQRRFEAPATADHGPTAITVPPRSVADCKALTGGQINEDFARCRRGYVEYR